MFALQDHDSQNRVRDAVLAASVRSDVHEAIRNVYHALQDQIELRRPVCTTSGRCCRFDEFGHRLFITTMEAGTFLHELKGTPGPSTPPGNGACPFQFERLCTVHQIRPFGCRIFFCDETAALWQERQYEAFHAELRRLHERLAVPYFYVEWREFLRLASSEIDLVGVQSPL